MAQADLSSGGFSLGGFTSPPAPWRRFAGGAAHCPPETLNAFWQLPGASDARPFGACRTAFDPLAHTFDLFAVTN